jgi:hypothetical protein
LDKTIVTTFLVIAGIVSAVLIFNSVYPALVSSSEAMTSMERRMDERLKSQIQIIHATGLGSNTLVWVKNVGALRVSAVEACDVFFGPEGAFARIPYGGPTAPYWTYTVENGSEWNPTTTIKITINSTLTPGVRYFVKVVLPNGVSDEYYFGG